MIRHVLLASLAGVFIAGCTDSANGQAGQTASGVVSSGAQRGGGHPYEVSGSEVWDVPDPVSGRVYQLFVALPASYGSEPGRRYPVLYVTDADYAFPVIKQIARRLNVEKPTIEEFILVGLSYAKGEGGMESRRRDYTPTSAGTTDAPKDAVHGQADAYATYIRDQALPFVAAHYRSDEGRRFFLGHSYGALLGAHILLRQPDLFRGYVLGSPSFWYDHHYMTAQEAAYSANHHDLPAQVYMYVGEYEGRRPGDSRFSTSVDMVADMKAMDRTLRSRNFPSLRMQSEVLNDEDHVSVAPRGFTHGLKYLLPVQAK